jgi:hypothetical protein
VLACKLPLLFAGEPLHGFLQELSFVVVDLLSKGLGLLLPRLTRRVQCVQLLDQLMYLLMFVGLPLAPRVHSGRRAG